MNERMYQLIHDPNVNFFLHPTPELKRLIVQNEHPCIKKLRRDAKRYLLEGKVLPLDKADVLSFIQGTLDVDGTFLFKKGEIRVVGEPSIVIAKTEKRN